MAFSLLPLLRADPYGVYRPSYGSAVSSGDSSSGVGASGIIGNLNSGLATGESFNSFLFHVLFAILSVPYFYFELCMV